MITSENFLSQVREKYPEYNDVEDEKLYNALIQKYPEYETKVEPYKPKAIEQPEEQSDLYTESADNLLQNEMQKTIDLEKQEAESFDLYSKGVKYGTINPDLETFSAFKKNFNPTEIEETIAGKYRIAPISSEDLGDVFVPSESKAVTRQDSYEQEFNMLLKEPGAQDYLRKVGTNESVTSDEFTEIMKGLEDDLINKKITELTTVDDAGDPKMAHIESSDGSKFNGKITDVGEDEITIQTFDNKIETIKLNDVNLLTSVMNNVENKIEMFPKIAQEEIPTYTSFDNDIQSSLASLAIDGRFNEFVKTYLYNSIGKSKAEGLLATQKSAIAELEKQYGYLKGPYSSHGVKNAKEIYDNIMSNPTSYINDIIDGSISPDEYIENNMIQEAKKAFYVIQESPEYYVGKLSKEQISAKSENLYFDKLLNKDVDNMTSTTSDIAESYKDWKEAEQSGYEKLKKFYNYNLASSFPKLPKGQYSIFQAMDFNIDGTVDMNGTWELHKKKMLKAGGTNFNPYSVIGIDESFNPVIKSLLEAQVDQNKALKLPEWLGGGDSGDIGLEFSHHTALETTISIAGSDVKFRVKGYGGVEGLQQSTNPNDWVPVFVPDSEYLQEKQNVQVVDDTDAGDYIVNAAVGIVQAASTVASITTSIVGFLPQYGAAAIAATIESGTDYYTGESAKPGYKGKWAKTFERNTQPILTPDATGQAVTQTVFAPITYTVDAIHSTFDYIKESQGIKEDDQTAAAWSAFILETGASMFAGYYGYRKGYMPIASATSKILTTKGGVQPFRQGVRTFIKESQGYAPFAFIGTPIKQQVKRYTINNPSVYRSKWVQDMSLRFGHDIKKHSALSVEPWNMLRNEAKVPTYVLLPSFKGVGDSLLDVFNIKKSFEMKKVKLPSFFDVKTYTRAADHLFISKHLPDILSDFATLNILEFRAKWRTHLDLTKIKDSEILKFHKHFMKDPKFKKMVKQKDDYRTQLLYLDSKGRKAFDKKYGDNKGTPVFADMVSSNNKVGVVRAKDGKYELVITNPNKSIKIKYDKKDDALMALDALHWDIAGAAQTYAIQKKTSYSMALTNTLADPNKKGIVSTFDHGLITGENNLFLSLITAKVPEVNASAIMQISDKLRRNNSKLFESNPDKTAINIVKDGKGGVDIHVGVIVPKDSKQLNLFAEKNNSTITDIDGNIIKKSDGSNMHSISNMNENKLIKEVNNLLSGKTPDIRTLSSFEKANQAKEDLSLMINNLKEKQLLLKEELKNTKLPVAKKVIETKLAEIDETVKGYYLNLDQIDKAFSTGKVPIEKVYHGNNKKVTEEPFDQSKISTIIHDTNPQRLAQKLNPKLWKKMMKNKSNAAEPWRVATEIIKGELRKNPEKLLSTGSEYIMFRRLDSDVFQIPEFFHAPTGRYFSPDYNVSKAYSLSTGRSSKPKSYPEVDEFYSIATVPPKPIIKKKDVKPKPIAKKKDVKVVKNVDDKKGKVKSLKPEELSELTLPSQKKYLIEKLEKNTKIIKKNVEERLKKKGINIKDVNFNDYLNKKELAFINSMNREISKVNSAITRAKQNDEMYTWYGTETSARGTADPFNVRGKLVVKKMPEELKNQIDVLTPELRKIKDMEIKLNSIDKNKTPGDYHFTKAQLTNLKKDYNKKTREQLVNITKDLTKEKKQIVNDLNAANKGQIKLLDGEKKAKEDTVSNIEKILKKLKEVSEGKADLSDAVFYSTIMPGLPQIIKIVNNGIKSAKKLGYKFKLSNLSKELEFLTGRDFIVSTSGTVIPRAILKSGIYKDFPIMNAYRRALKIYGKAEAKVFINNQKIDQFHKLVRDDKKAFDVIAYIEKNKKGNMYYDNDSYAKVVERVNSSPKLKEAVKIYKKVLSDVYNDINQELKKMSNKEHLNFIENYIPHIWNIPGKNITNAAKSFKALHHAKKRLIPTIEEGLELGYKLKYHHPSQILRKYVETQYYEVRNKQLLHLTKSAKDLDNMPMTMSSSDWIKINNRLQKEKRTIEVKYKFNQNADFKEEIASVKRRIAEHEKWQTFEQDFVTRVYGKTSTGILISKKDPLMVNPQLAEILTPVMKNMYKPDGKLSMLVKGYDAVSNGLKSIFFMGSLFHPISLAESFGSIGMRGYNPLGGFIQFGVRDPGTGTFKLMTTTNAIGRRIIKNRPDIMEDAISHNFGINTSTIDYSHNAVSDLMNKIINVAKRETKNKNDLVSRLTRGAVYVPAVPTKLIMDGFNKIVWGYHENAKVAMYYKTLQEQMKRFPNADPFMLKVETANFINNAVGGQASFMPPINKINRMWNDPSVRKYLGRFFLAPDWTFSVNQVGWKAGRRDFGSKTWARIKDSKMGSYEKFYYGDKDFRRLSNALYRNRYWAKMPFNLAMMAKLTEEGIYHFYGDEKIDKPRSERYKPGNLFDIDVTPLLRRMNEKSTLDLSFPAEDARKRLANDIAEGQKFEVGLGKQVEEVWKWVGYTAEAGVNAIIGGHAEMSLEDAQSKFLHTWTSKINVPIQSLYGFAVGESLSGYPIHYEHSFDGLGLFEKTSKKVGALMANIAPITLRGKTLFLTLPMKKDINKHNANKLMKDLFALYAEENFRVDIYNQYGRGVAGANFDEYVKNLENIVTPIMKQLKENGLDAKDLFNKALKEKANFYVDKMFDLMNYKINDVEDVDWEQVTYYAFSLNRLHVAADQIAKHLEGKGFDIYSESKEYKEMKNKFAEIIKEIPKEGYDQKKGWIYQDKNGMFRFSEGAVPNYTKGKVDYWKDAAQRIEYFKGLNNSWREVFDLDEE